MRLLRTASGTFVNGDLIVDLLRSGDDWLAILEGGEAVPLDSYYREPGRIERRRLPQVLSRRAPAETCAADECCLDS